MHIQHNQLSECIKRYLLILHCTNYKIFKWFLNGITVYKRQYYITYYLLSMSSIAVSSLQKQRGILGVLLCEQLHISHRCDRVRC